MYKLIYHNIVYDLKMQVKSTHCLKAAMSQYFTQRIYPSTSSDCSLIFISIFCHSPFPYCVPGTLTSSYISVFCVYRKSCPVWRVAYTLPFFTHDRQIGHSSVFCWARKCNSPGQLGAAVSHHWPILVGRGCETHMLSLGSSSASFLSETCLQSSCSMVIIFFSLLLYLLLCISTCFIACTFVGILV